ncbi:hypothetical protein PARHAE_03921 [Paracoccus haematequi]|uniref:Uncharacterized protein n=1 Tax=Paracoccus haematequi TaxID=2491866 RepID=A0A3S4CMQ0_9RHOB|nr:hypothetical protein PARHAE_03921 [Paracoccus haematequi]
MAAHLQVGHKRIAIGQGFEDAAMFDPCAMATPLHILMLLAQQDELGVKFLRQKTVKKRIARQGHDADVEIRILTLREIGPIRMRGDTRLMLDEHVFQLRAGFVIHVQCGKTGGLSLKPFAQLIKRLRLGDGEGPHRDSRIWHKMRQTGIHK